MDICKGGAAHTISFRFDGAHYHIWIDGKEVSDIHRSEQFSAGNAKAEDDPKNAKADDEEFQEILIGCGIGTVRDKEGRTDAHALFEKKSAVPV